MHYDVLGDPIFRERDVPRMLELATARADGDTSVPAELSTTRRAAQQGKAARREAHRRTAIAPRAPDAPVLVLRSPLDPADCRPPAVATDGSRWIAGGVAAVGRAGAALPFTRRRPAGRSRRDGPAARRSSTRTRTSSCPGCADAFRPPGASPTGSASCWHPAPAPRRPTDHGLHPLRRIAQARASGTALVGDVSNTLVTVDLLRGSLLKGVVFHELVRFRAADADAVARAGIERDSTGSGTSSRVVASAWRRTRRTRYRRCCFRGSSRRDAAADGALRRCTWLNRRKKWSFSVRATGRAASCSRISARGTPRGRRRTADPSSTSHA